jgi:ATP-dependent DNA helicase HFM1/MER3
MHKKPAYSYFQGGEHNLSFLQPPNLRQSDGSSDYGDMPLEDASPHSEMSQPTANFQELVQLSDGIDANDFMDYPATAPVASRGSDLFGDDDSLLGDAMIGLADSQNLQETGDSNHHSMDTLEEALNMEYEASFLDDDIPMDIDYTMHDDDDWQAHDTTSASLAVQAPVVFQELRLQFGQDSSITPQRRSNDFKPAKAMLKDADLEELKLPQVTPRHELAKTSSKVLEEDIEVLDLLDDFDEPPVKKVPDAFKDLEPWIYQQFGGIVELVDE